MPTVKICDWNKVIKVCGKIKSRNPNTSVSSMLSAFAEIIPGCTYFYAKSDESSKENKRFGLMSIKQQPPHILLEGNFSTSQQSLIEGTLWVEGLVAEEGSGLGSILLDAAETYALKNRRTGVSLAAYEDSLGGKPYSASGYYEKKRGMTYSGEGYKEDQEGGSLYHPIYYKFLPYEAKL